MSIEAWLTLLSLFVGLMVPIGGALWWWLWKLTGEVADTKLDLAKNYHSKEELGRMLDAALDPIKKQLDRLIDALDHRR